MERYPQDFKLMPEHPITILVRNFFLKYFKQLDVSFTPPDHIIDEPYITVQGTKPSKKGQTIYCLTFEISELEREIIEGDGLEAYLALKLGEVFETKDLSDYYRAGFS